MTDSLPDPDGYTGIEKIDAHMHMNCGRRALTDIAGREGFHLVTVNTDVSFFPDLQQQQRFALKTGRRSGGRISFLTSFESSGFGRPGWADQAIEQIRSGIREGAVAVKIWKNFGMELHDSGGRFIMADDPALDPVYEYLSGEEIPLLAHLGEPKNCWLPAEEMTVLSDRTYFSNYPQYHMYKQPNFPTYEEQLQARDRVLQKHPGLQFIGAHLASLEWSVDALAEWLNNHPGCGVDMAERVCHLQHQASQDPHKVREFMICYQDRLIYGSDHIDDGDKSPAKTQEAIRAKWRNEFRFFSEDGVQHSSIVAKPFKGLGLKKEILLKLFRMNALSYYPRLNTTFNKTTA